MQKTTTHYNVTGEIKREINTDKQIHNNIMKVSCFALTVITLIRYCVTV